MWMKGIGNGMALYLIVYYQDLAAYPILAFLLLFILPLASTWSSIYLSINSKSGICILTNSKGKEPGGFHQRERETAEAWPHVQPTTIHPIPKFIQCVSGLFPTPRQLLMYGSSFWLCAAPSSHPCMTPWAAPAILDHISSKMPGS